MECIACAACIDVCDEVMTRVKKPRGLIKYISGTWVRPRTVIYVALLTVFMVAFGVTLANRHEISASFVRAIDTPYQVDGDEVVNRFRVSLSNQTFDPVSLRFDSPSVGVQLVTAIVPLKLLGGERATADLFVRFPKAMLAQGRAKLEIRVLDGSKETRKEVTLVGPYH
jgi:polyferredoxin